MLSGNRVPSRQKLSRRQHSTTSHTAPIWSGRGVGGDAGVRGLGRGRTGPGQAVSPRQVWPRAHAAVSVPHRRKPVQKEDQQSTENDPREVRVVRERGKGLRRRVGVGSGAAWDADAVL